MHPSTLAARRQLAGDRIDAAISQLAEHAGVAVPEQEPVRDRDARDLFRLEALADAIESIAASLLPETSGTPSPPSQGTPRVGDLTAAEIAARVADINDLIGLEAMLSDERDGKHRTTVVTAIEGRIAKLRGG